MAVYKVIQDIEAEDKLLGPLSLKGLIYAGMAAALGFLNFQLLTSGAPVLIKLPLGIILFLPMLLFGVLASPLGRDQPTEVWLLARVKFLLKPRQRVWNQSGLSQLVTITAPKRIERILTKGYGQAEVQSRLKALAATLDSRGWVVKNVNVNLNAHPDYLMSMEDISDRLVAPSSMVEAAPVIDVQADDDILDEKNNSTAQKFQSMMAAAEQRRKQDLAKKLEAARIQAQTQPVAVPAAPVTKTPAVAAEPAKTPQPAPAAPEPRVVMGTTIIRPGEVVPIAGHGPQVIATTPEEQRLLDELHQRQAVLDSIAGKRPVIKPLHGEKVIQPPGSMTTRGQTDKLELAQSGNDFSVATIARLANRAGAA